MASAIEEEIPNGRKNPETIGKPGEWWSSRRVRAPKCPENGKGENIFNILGLSFSTENLKRFKIFFGVMEFSQI